jgi:hypothetical protein
MYGVLVVVVPADDTWPEELEQQSRAENEEMVRAWRDRLTAWESNVVVDADALGARAVLSFTPMYQPAVAQTNVWLDRVGEDLGEAMNAAAEAALGLSSRGHVIRCVQIFNWAQQPNYQANRR